MYGSPQCKSPISQSLEEEGDAVSSRGWLQPKRPRQMRSLRLLIFLCWSHPILNFAFPNRAFWNATAITHSVVKGWMPAFLEEYHSVNQPPGAAYPTDGCHTSTHMGPKAELWIFSPIHILDFFICILNLLHCCFRTNSPWEISFHISFNTPIKGTTRKHLKKMSLYFQGVSNLL